MDYTNIETFLAIAETRSLSKAAEKLFLSQSTISYRLKVLEQEVGADLIQREQGKGFITMTAKGEEFISISQRWMSILKDIKDWKTQKPLHKLNIGCVDSLNTCIFYKLYKKLLGSDDHLVINVSSHWTVTIYELIESYEIDVGFASWQLPSKNIISKPVFSEKMVLISSVDSNFPDEVHPKDLDQNKEIFFYCGPNFQMWHDNWWDNTKQEYSTVDTALLLNSLIDVPNYWSIVPISIAKKLEKLQDIKISKIINPPPDRVCFQITSKHPMPSKLEALQIFHNYLEDFLKSDFFNSIIN